YFSRRQSLCDIADYFDFPFGKAGFFWKAISVKASIIVIRGCSVQTDERQFWHPLALDMRNVRMNAQRMEWIAPIAMVQANNLVEQPDIMPVCFLHSKVVAYFVIPDSRNIERLEKLFCRRSEEHTSELQSRENLV